MDNQIILSDQGSTLPVPLAMSPMQMIANAVAGGASIDVIERLVALKERMDAAEAKNAYTEAMAAFKQDVPTILKNRHVEFGSGQSKTSYNHADLASVCNAVIPELAKYGLSHSWEPSIGDGGAIRVTVVITHVKGHSESAFLEGPADTSGGKNAIQARISTTTYLSRATLLMRLGMAAQEMDDDGRGSEESFISMDEVEQIQEGIAKARGDVGKFCRTLNINSLSEIKTKDKNRVWEMINAKRAALDLEAQKKAGAK